MTRGEGTGALGHPGHTQIRKKTNFRQIWFIHSKEDENKYPCAHSQIQMQWLKTSTRLAIKSDSKTSEFPVNQLKASVETQQANKSHHLQWINSQAPHTNTSLYSNASFIHKYGDFSILSCDCLSVLPLITQLWNQNNNKESVSTRLPLTWDIILSQHESTACFWAWHSVYTSHL